MPWRFTDQIRKLQQKLIGELLSDPLTSFYYYTLAQPI